MVENNKNQHVVIHSQSTDQHLTQKHSQCPHLSVFYPINKRADVAYISV